jgi:hypothetical protein
LASASLEIVANIPLLGHHGQPGRFWEREASRIGDSASQNLKEARREGGRLELDPFRIPAFLRLSAFFSVGGKKALDILRQMFIFVFAWQTGVESANWP